LGEIVAELLLLQKIPQQLPTAATDLRPQPCHVHGFANFSGSSL